MNAPVHRVEVAERKEIKVLGVQHVDSFTDTEIALETNMGNLVLSGEGLHIVQLNLDEGLLVAEGLLHAFRYREGGVRARDAGKKIWARILR
ncbi:MAG: sporulation protein YabP [Bacillota bacterium]